MRGDLTEETKQSLREQWYPKMSARLKIPANRLRHLPFLQLASEGKLPEVLGDLRREEKQSCVRKSVARKIAALDASSSLTAPSVTSKV
jgi:hypothetical protein